MGFLASDFAFLDENGLTGAFSDRSTMPLFVYNAAGLVWCRALIAGGGAPEIELAIRLLEHSQTLTGMEQYCLRAFAEALDVIPFTLAENAGLNPIATVTELRNHHAQGQRTFGINVRKVTHIIV